MQWEPEIFCLDLSLKNEASGAGSRGLCPPTRMMEGVYAKYGSGFVAAHPSTMEPWKDGDLQCRRKARKQQAVPKNGSLAGNGESWFAVSHSSTIRLWMNDCMTASAPSA